MKTGYSALFSESVKKVKHGNDKAQKDLEALEGAVKAHVAFFKLAKNTETPKYVEAETHPKVKYLKECMKDNSLIIPIINKIIGKVLLIRDVKITTGQAKGLQANMEINQDIIQKLYLDDNSLDGF